MSKSTRSEPRSKPAKPYEGFPLFAHPSGMWAKKIRKRLVYFVSWRIDPDGTAALEKFNREWPYLKDGRTPPEVDVSSGCTLKALVNDFLKSKEEMLNAGELSPHSFRDYYRTCAILIDQFKKDRHVADLAPADFRTFRAKLAERFGVVSLKNVINRVCIVFNYAHENNLIDKPVLYGQCFDRPNARALRKDRRAGGAKLYEREEVLAILNAADVQLKAMILLGVNCGFGNTDVASLPISAVDLETGWINFPRPKTQIDRRAPLWPETIAALKTALAVRIDATDPAASGLCFVTRTGRPWVRIQEKATDERPEEDKHKTRPAVPVDSLAGQFSKLLRRLDINGRRGLGFYTLRHCFETQAGESKDQVAVDAIMGHVDSSMAANYRHRISDERLRAVVEVVRTWLFDSPSKSPEGKEEGGAA